MSTTTKIIEFHYYDLFGITIMDNAFKISTNMPGIGSVIRKIYV